MPCIEQQMQTNNNLSMALFVGDLGYDFQGIHYKAMLEYIQVVTSKMVFMVTPGNHDTTHHSDTFEFFTQSFYSPHWRSYYNYFYTIKLGRVVFIAYNPQAQVFQHKQPDRLQINFTSVFQTQFTTQVIHTLSNQYFPIVFTHYPIYCSDIYDDHDTCTKNPQRLQFYKQLFEEMQIKLYLAGHVHVYQRTKPICPNNHYVNNKDSIYDYSCPIHVIEGAGGNDFYVQTEDQYPKKNFTEALVYNTGFGILSLAVNQNNPYPYNLTYKHFSSQNCTVKDQFVMIGQQAKGSDPSSSTNNGIITKTLFKIAIIAGGIIALVILGIQVRNRFGKKQNRPASQKSTKQHIEMVEEQFQTPNVKKTENNDNNELETE